MKIPFDITKRPQIESGEYKVETNDHHPVRIICWNKNTGGLDRIVALVAGSSGQEKTLHYTEEGLCVASGGNKNKDLFIVTPGPELNEFEQAVKDLCWKVGILGEVFYKDDIIKKTAAELLDLARKELTCQGNIVLSIEEFEKCFIEAQEKGRKEALKDLPRWEKTSNKGTYVDASNIFYHDGYYLGIKTLEKLPGFKED